MARTPGKAALAALLATAAAASAASAAATAAYPAPPLPYSTTLLRTHHYADALFLSVGEELSVRQPVAGGSVWEAYMIAPGWPFDLRDDPTDPTVVNGLRVVYEYAAANGTYTIWYYATNLDGVEECLTHGTYAWRPFQPDYEGEAVVRGIATDVWRDYDPGTGVTTTHFVTPDLGGALYPFRVHTRYPSGSGEVEWTLDHGTHYAVEQTAWFNTSGCTDADRARSPLAARLGPKARPMPHNPWIFLAYPKH